MNLQDAAQEIDALWNMEHVITTLAARLDKLKAERTLRLNAVRMALLQVGVTALAGQVGEAEIFTKAVYSMDPEQWSALYDRIRATGEFDLLEKRIKQTAMRERFDNGDEVPGVRRIELQEIRLTGKKP